MHVDHYNQYAPLVETKRDSVSPASKYEDMQIKNLRKLQASIKMLCVLTRGFSMNLQDESFYEHHEFLNLTGTWLHDADYMIGEHILTMYGNALHSLREIDELSLVKDADKMLTHPAEIYNFLLPAYEKVAEHMADIFKLAGPTGGVDPATIFLSVQIAAKLKHFAWEIGVMAKKWKTHGSASA
jgi:DNA-binding ferritin-like protein